MLQGLNHAEAKKFMPPTIVAQPQVLLFFISFFKYVLLRLPFHIKDSIFFNIYWGKFHSNFSFPFSSTRKTRSSFKIYMENFFQALNRNGGEEELWKCF